MRYRNVVQLAVILTLAVLAELVVVWAFTESVKPQELPSWEQCSRLACKPLAEQGAHERAR